jgi:hypothetical protein
VKAIERSETMRRTQEEITIRPLGEQDQEALAHLAQIDTSSLPPAPLLGASSDGRLLAARSLVTGESIADPWVRTSGLAELLEQRASDLGARPRRWWRRRSRASLPASPPGAGGRLLDLHARST